MSKKVNYDKRIFIRIDDKSKADFQKVCAKNNINSSDLLRQFIKVYIDKHDNTN